MKGFSSKEQVERIKENYPEGTIVKVNSMEDDFAPVPSGTIGEVVGVDDIGSIMVKWQNGQSLSLLPYEDEFEVVSKPNSQEQTEEIQPQAFKMKMI